MTPTPEMERMAERIADETGTPRGCQVWTTAKTAALAAIMEERERIPDEIEIYRIMKGAGRKRSDMAKAVAASLRPPSATGSI